MAGCAVCFRPRLKNAFRVCRRGNDAYDSDIGTAYRCFAFRVPAGAALAPERDRQRALEVCSRVIGDAALPASVRSDALLTRADIYSLLIAIDLKTAVELDPANIVLRKRRGYRYFTMERFDIAIPDYSEAIRLDPNDAEAYRERGDVWLRRERFGEAIADYRQSSSSRSMR
jgi:tetratricopeptide (TPR) repeat protein